MSKLAALAAENALGFSDRPFTADEAATLLDLGFITEAMGEFVVTQAGREFLEECAAEDREISKRGGLQL